MNSNCILKFLKTPSWVVLLHIFLSRKQKHFKPCKYTNYIDTRSRFAVIENAIELNCNCCNSRSNRTY